MRRYLIFTIFYIFTFYTIGASLLAHFHDIAYTLIYIALSFTLSVLSSTGTIKSTLFLAISPWHKILLTRYRQPAQVQKHHMPLVSVIIPAWNEAVGITNTIKTILANSYPRIEIVVVNDGSTDNSEAVIQEFIRKYTHVNMVKGITNYTPILYHHQINKGRGGALNTGIKMAHGDIIVCIDADCVMDRECITHFVQSMDNPQVMGSTGNIKMGNTQSFWVIAQVIEYAVGLYSHRADELLNTIYIISGAAGAFRREIFEKIGYFGERHMTEDMDLSFRMQQAGMKIVYAPDAIVYTEGPSTLQGLLKQRIRWNRGRMETFKQYPRFFFSTKEEHSKVLTWFHLPLIAFNDWVCVLLLIIKVALYTYCIITHTYEIIALIAIISAIITGIPLWEDREHRAYILYAPISWLLFLVLAFVQAYTVILARWGMWRKSELRWQSWQRKGVIK